MTSRALWIPLLWIMIIGSRSVSLWTGERVDPDLTPAGYLEGSPQLELLHYGDAQFSLATLSVKTAAFVPTSCISEGGCDFPACRELPRIRHLAALPQEELAVGGALGITMGLGGWMLGLFRGGSQVALVVALAMVLIVVMANILGALLPFLLTRLRLDPAVASSPLIASVTDGIGLIIYFSIASKIIGAL